MIKNLIIMFMGMTAIFSVILFSEVSGSASETSTAAEKLQSEDIVKFTIKPITLRMYPGGSMQLIATAYDSKGKKIIVTPEWKIKSDISALGEFDKSEGEKVIFSALNSGSGTIVAVFNDLEAEVRVEVYKKRGK